MSNPLSLLFSCLFCTLLSLLVVPAVYTYVDDAEALLARLNARLRRQPLPESNSPRN